MGENYRLDRPYVKPIFYNSSIFPLKFMGGAGGASAGEIAQRKAERKI
jgi:hypothetical protein